MHSLVDCWLLVVYLPYRIDVVYWYVVLYVLITHIQYNLIPAVLLMNCFAVLLFDVLSKYNSILYDSTHFDFSYQLSAILDTTFCFDHL